MNNSYLFFLILFLVTDCTSDNLNETDIREIYQLEKGYVSGWFNENQKEAVLSVFEDNAVFIPHHGDNPVIGKEQLKNFFWPDNFVGIVHSFNHYPT